MEPWNQGECQPAYGPSEQVDDGEPRRFHGKPKSPISSVTHWSDKAIVPRPGDPNRLPKRGAGDPARAGPSASLSAEWVPLESHARPAESTLTSRFIRTGAIGRTRADGPARCRTGRHSVRSIPHRSGPTEFITAGNSVFGTLEQILRVAPSSDFPCHPLEGPNRVRS